MAEDKPIAIKFVQGYSPYQAGEIAGFGKARAKFFVDKGIARPADKDAEKALRAFAKQASTPEPEPEHESDQEPAE